MALALAREAMALVCHSKAATSTEALANSSSLA
eukprot:CAMPEP_0171144836 /NCGR_PEP_ID=MMETSP0766_2-20121228/146615_1 /TAXON_ID=439317 /ORGANISM="Gambierdiscus australes, Strain CAWD 149" /LENGTH=32 /DNA_ID= /DNA_START= /DNA_END= /DNA_ORIENTATION=